MILFFIVDAHGAPVDWLHRSCRDSYDFCLGYVAGVRNDLWATRNKIGTCKLVHQEYIAVRQNVFDSIMDGKNDAERDALETVKRLFRSFAPCLQMKGEIEIGPDDEAEFVVHPEGADIVKQKCEFSRHYCAGFIQAAIHIVVASSGEKSICLPNGITYDELTDGFLRYYGIHYLDPDATNIEKRFAPALEIITAVLKKNYACHN